MDIINKFLQVRNIPYSIPLSLTDRNNSCSGKCLELYAYFKENGYQVKYRVCTFSWDEIGLPDFILDIQHEKLSTHVYLEILIDGKWIDVDPTWDNKLWQFFTINEWDGKTSTKIAVPIKDCYGTETSFQIMNTANTDDIEKDLSKYRAFYKALNEWLTEIRKKSHE